jgi:DNA-binding NarL/FixJ family response regulator
VLVADSEPVFGVGALKVLAEAGIPAAAVVGIASGEPGGPRVLERLVDQVRAFAATGLVLDASLGGRPYAVDLVSGLMAADPGLAVVVSIGRVRPDGLVDVMEAGARALIHRQCAPEELVAAVVAALHGQNWVAAPVASLLRAELLSEASGEGAGLTAREVEVLRGLVAGGSNADIAVRMGISENTVRNHVHAVLRKLGAANRTDAVATALRRGLVELSD